MALKAIRPMVRGLRPAVAAPPKRADPFYLSTEWRQLVREVKAERGAYCERCGSTKGLIADHVAEIRDGGARLDKGNVELLCGLHHNRKTAQARARRARGQAARGT